MTQDTTQRHLKVNYNHRANYSVLLYLSDSTHAVIGQFSGRILLYGPLKFEAVFVAKMFRDLSPSILKLL